MVGSAAKDTADGDDSSHGEIFDAGAGARFSFSCHIQGVAANSQYSS